LSIESAEGFLAIVKFIFAAKLLSDAAPDANTDPPAATDGTAASAAKAKQKRLLRTR
jgi:hypothetical protein